MIKKYENYILSINDEINEDKIFESTIQNPNLSIVMPGGCNGKCDFCFWKKSKPCDNYLEKLNNILYGLPSQFYQLSITGGEPTLSPYLENVLNLIDRNIFTHTVLTSNGCKLIDFVPKLEGKIDHINISRHHFDDEINNSIFKSKMLTTNELKKVTDELNKVDIDVTFSAVLSEKLNTNEDIEKYIQFSKDCGASQVFFRKPHGTLEPTEVELTYEGYKSNEYSCPVCRTKVQKIHGINVSWKASLEEPSKELGTIYELIINENADVAKDWEGKLKVDYTKVNEVYKQEYKQVFEDCGGSSSSRSSYSSCGGYSGVKGCSGWTPKKSKKNLSSCGTEISSSCGGNFSGGCGFSEPSGPPYFLINFQAKIRIVIDSDEEMEQVLDKFSLKRKNSVEWVLPKNKIQEITDFIIFIRDINKYNL